MKQRKNRGAVLLEFAVALPFALTLFIGIADFSAYFWRQTQMEEVARIAVARMTPALGGYAAADAETLHRFTLSLQEDVRGDSGLPNLTVELTRQYACPLTSGADQELTSEPQLCTGERVYLRVASHYAVEPLLGPLRSMGFPETAFSRHVIRIR